MDSFLIAGWVLTHFLLAIDSFCSKKNVNIFLVSGLVIIGFVLFLKPNTYDLIAYLDFFNQPFPTDIGFYNAVLLMNYFGFTENFTLLIFQSAILTALLFVLYVVIEDTKFSSNLFLVCCSLFFILATQNILRQGISVSFALLAYSFFIRKSGWRSARYALMLISISFHFWTIILCGLFLIEFFLRFVKRRIYFRSGFWAEFIIGSFLGFMALFFISTLNVSEVYIDSAYEWEGNRTSVLLRAIAYSTVFYAIHFIIHNLYINNPYRCFYSLRVLIFSFTLPLVFHPEVFSRIQVFYIAVELIIFSTLYYSCSVKKRVAFLVLLASYSFAPNAWNILTFVQT